MCIWFLLAARFTTSSSSSDAFMTGQAIFILPAFLTITSADAYISKSWSMLILSNESGRFTIMPLQTNAIFSWRYYFLKNLQ